MSAAAIVESIIRSAKRHGVHGGGHVYLCKLKGVQKAAWMEWDNFTTSTKLSVAEKWGRERFEQEEEWSTRRRNKAATSPKCVPKYLNGARSRRTKAARRVRRVGEEPVA